MGVEILIPISFFLFVFALVYLHYSTRNKERMALIEKGAEASIFFSGKNGKGSATGKMLVLNLALVLVGVGLAIFIGSVMENAGLDEDVAYPGSIFLMAGIGLLVGFFMNKKMENED